MKRRSKSPNDLDKLRDKIIGLGEKSIRKSYFPELQRRLSDLELFRTLLDQSLDAIFLVRVSTGALSDVNQSACSLLGYARDELLSRSLTDLIEEPESGQIAGMLSRKPDQGQGVNIPVSLVAKDGRPIPAEMTLRLVESGGGMHAVAVARDVTERKKAEEQLKTTLNKLENVIEFLPDATFIIDRDKRIIAWNRAMEDMTGVPKKSILGRDHRQSTLAFYGELRPYLMDLVDKEDGEIAAKYAFVKRTGNSLYAEAFAPALYGGRGGHIWAIASRLYDSEGNVTGIIESIRDITEQKLARDALSQSEERYRSLFENAIEGIFQTTLDGRLIMLNTSLARMLGYEDPQHAMRVVTDIAAQVYADPEDRKAVIRSLTLEGKVLGREVLFKKLDGAHIKVILNMILVTGDEDQGTYIEGSCIDITEKWRAEEALRASEEKYRNIFENATEGIYQTTPEGRYLSVNPAFARMFGFDSPQNMIDAVKDIGKELYVNPEDRQEMVSLLREHDRVEGYEVEVFRKDRSRFWISINIHTVRGDAGNVLCLEGTNVDVTERKQAEQALRESEARIREIIDNAPFGAHSYTIHDDGRLIFRGRNPAADRILKMDHSPLIGMEIEEAFPVLKGTDVAENYRRVALLGGRWVKDVVQYDGKDISGAFEVFAFQTGQGRMTAFFRDITRRKTAEKALREREELLRATLNATADGILVVDGSGRISQMNRQFIEMWRVPPELQGTGYDEELLAGVLDQLEDPASFLSKVRSLYRTAREDLDEVRFKDGRVFERYSCPMIMEGMEAGRVWDFRDITKRKQAEDAMRASEARYRRLYDSMMDAFVSTSMDGTILECNDAYLAMLGYGPDEITRLTYKDITPEKWHTLEAKIVEKEVMVWGYSESYQKEYRKKDGTEFPVELRSYLLRDDDGKPAGMWAIVRDITDRKRAENALRDSERHLADIIEFLPDATLVIDKQGKVTAWNKAMEAMTGVAAHEMIGKGDYEYSVPFYGEPRPILIDLVLMPKEEVERKYYHIKRKGDLLIGETDVPVVRGEKRFLSGWAHPIYDVSGQIIGAIESIRDITDRHRAEEALSESEALYRLLAENASDMITRHRPDGTILYVTPSCESMLGYAPDEMTGKSASDFTVPEDMERIWKAFNAASDAGEDRYRVEFRLIRKDGSLLWAETVSRLIRDAQGVIVEVQSSIRDISKRREAEEALKENETRYRLLAENASDIIFTLDMDLRFTYISPSVEKIRGYTVEEAMGQGIEQVLAPGSLEHAIRVFQEEMEKEKVERLELWRKRTLELEEVCRDGSTIWTETTFSILRDTEKRLSGFLGITRDISERRRSAMEKSRLESQLAQAQKMESIGTLAGGIAHDFNNILAAIIGYSELALDDLASPEKARFEIGEVVKAGDRARNLVSQILTFSRKTETVYSPLALRTIVKESLKMLRSVIPTTIEIRQDLADTGLVMSDPTQVNQIIMNLCTNAAHAMEESGGVLELKLKRVRLDKDAAVALDILPGPYLRLTVSDTGHGMPQEVMDKIFEPYFTTKEIGRGTGLGLSVVHGIAKSHGGAVTCSSTPGKGTTFEVYLPEVESAGKGVERMEKEPYQKGTERILFVDDEPALVSLAEKMLGKMGYQVSPKTDSREALAAFRDDPHLYDLVITDMTMPGIPGDMLARKLLEIRSDIPVILCTGYSERTSEEKARQMGVRAFVLKPFEMRDLARTIRTVLDEKK